MRPAPPEVDGDGSGAVGASEAVHQCSRCTDPSRPDEGPTYTFTFDAEHRRAAAATALKLSARQQNGFLIDNHMTATGTSSARFMSLSYFGGGFPMVLNCSHDPEGGYAEGWYLVADAAGHLEGSRVWSLHNTVSVTTEPPRVNMPRSPDGEPRALDVVHGVGLGGLVGFISGQASLATEFLSHRASIASKAPEDFLPASPDVSATTSTPSVTYVTSGDALYTPIHNISSRRPGLSQPYAASDAARIEAIFLKIRRFVAGDYVFIDTEDTKGVDEHGMMVIGHGPAVLLRDPTKPWKTAAEYEQAVAEVMKHIDVKRTFDASGWEIEVTGLDPQKYHVQDYLYPGPDGQPDPDAKVPYVVDWNVLNSNPARLIHQKPRPFYFTTYQVTTIDPFFFAHNYWLFVPAATSITLRCDWHHAENVAGDKNAPFLIDTDASSDVIIKPAR